MLSYQDVILFILSKAYQKVYATFKSKTQIYGMTPMQGLVLHALYEEEGLSAESSAKDWFWTARRYPVFWTVWPRGDGS